MAVEALAAGQGPGKQVPAGRALDGQARQVQAPLNEGPARSET